MVQVVLKITSNNKTASSTYDYYFLKFSCEFLLSWASLSATKKKTYNHSQFYIFYTPSHYLWKFVIAAPKRWASQIVENMIKITLCTLCKTLAHAMMKINLYWVNAIELKLSTMAECRRIEAFSSTSSSSILSLNYISLFSREKNIRNIYDIKAPHLYFHCAP